MVAPADSVAPGRVWGLEEESVKCGLGRLIFAGMVLSALVVVACGSGDDRTPGSSTATQTAGEGTAPASPIPDPTFPLVEYVASDKGYALSYPEDWQIMAGPTQLADTYYYDSPDGRQLAKITVTCYEGSDWTAASMASIDAKIGVRLAGFNQGESREVQIGDVTGTMKSFSFRFNTFLVETVAVYAPRADCGWRVALNTWEPGASAVYLPLFERVISTFRFE